MVKTISFLLPGAPSHPTGGVKVVFEYANRLVAMGYNINIIYPGLYCVKHSSVRSTAGRTLRYIISRFNKPKPPKWFKLDSRIKIFHVFGLREHHVPKSDVYVATAFGTAGYLRNYKIPDSSKIYFIQGFENWHGTSSDLVYESYRYGFKNIVISDWLAKEGRKAGAECEIVKNGFDFDYFHLSKPIESRDPLRISMLYHSSEQKGCIYGLEALYLVKNRFPGLRAILFGVPPRPDGLPEWIEYYHCPDRPTHNAIYNNSSIYMAPSLQEGWGLPVGEAMICGNAIVCTDTQGFQEMVADGQEGFIVPAKNPRALANAMITLIENPDLRISMAHKGIKAVAPMTWDKSVARMVDIIKQLDNAI